MDEKRRTIVGGRSRGNRLLVDFPRSIEILLKKAKVDEEFRTLLLQDPLHAAESIQLELSEQEISTLKNVPVAILQTTIDNTPVPKQHIAAFRTARNAAVLALLLGTTAVVPPIAAAGTYEAPTYSAEQFYEAQARMNAVQQALESYKGEHGRYPTAQEWEANLNPLSGYVQNSELFDPWHRKFHYADYKEGGAIVGYRLESIGLDVESGYDNIPCPVNTDKHAFLEDSPITIQYPKEGQAIKSGPQTELRAAHQNPRVLVDWYLDDRSAGRTVGNNRLSVDLLPGKHTLVLVDENDYSSTVSFSAD